MHGVGNQARGRRWSDDGRGLPRLLVSRCSTAFMTKLRNKSQSYPYEKISLHSAATGQRYLRGVKRRHTWRGLNQISLQTFVSLTGTSLLIMYSPTGAARASKSHNPQARPPRLDLPFGCSLLVLHSLPACTQGYLRSQGVDNSIPDHTAVVTSFLDGLVQAAVWQEGPPTRAGKKGKLQYKGPNTQSVRERGCMQGCQGRGEGTCQAVRGATNTRWCSQ